MTKTIFQLMDEFHLTEEQKEVVTTISPSAAIISCPGSGKTLTAALRMGFRLSNWKTQFSGIALLSHTNVAIDSFEEKFKDLGYSKPIEVPHFMGTLDAFIARFLLTNFGHLVMNCSRSPTLTKGSEHFLKDSKFGVWFDKKSGGLYPKKITELNVGITINNEPYLFYTAQDGSEILPQNPSSALKVLQYLGQQGFYTYDHARYWGAKILQDLPHICEVLAHRFSEIIVDEAQDINPWQQKILCDLEVAGSKLMLIGDPDQAIFEFGFGSAAHLIKHDKQPGVVNKKLSKNLRSNQKIIAAAKQFGTIEMSSNRIEENSWEGAFLLGYSANKEGELIKKFQKAIDEYGLSNKNCVVIARSNELVTKLRGSRNTLKNSPTHQFAKAALRRDQEKNSKEAYEICEELILNICNAAQAWNRWNRDPNTYNKRTEVRRLLWQFMRDPEGGLPYASLNAKTEWYPKLKTSLERLCQSISLVLEVTPPKKLGTVIPNKDLPDSSLMDDFERDNADSSVRIDTVHKVKGETFDAAMYVTAKAHVNALQKKLADSMFSNELLKIAYVAMTRPKHVFWLAVPQDLLDKVSKELNGFELL